MNKHIRALIAFTALSGVWVLAAVAPEVLGVILILILTVGLSYALTGGFE